MEAPPEIIFHGMDPSAQVEEQIREKVGRLERIFPRITHCTVTVERPHVRREKGNLYQVKIHLHVPQKEIVVDRDPGDRNAHEDLGVTLRDAFRAAERQLKEYTERIRGEEKTHEPTPAGRVSELYPERDFGFIVSAEGRKVYFHRNSVIDGYEKLELGTEVHYTEEMGEEGPKASTVRIAGRHHHLLG